MKESSNSPVITNPNDIPSDEDDAEDYFDGMNPKEKPGPQQSGLRSVSVLVLICKIYTGPWLGLCLDINGN